MEMGFTFIWPPNQNPYFITPSGQVIQLEVKNNVPYIRAGSSFHKARRSNKRACYACGASNDDSVNVGATSSASVREPLAHGVAPDVALGTLPTIPMAEAYVPPPPAPYGSHDQTMEASDSPRGNYEHLLSPEHADRVLHRREARSLRLRANSTEHLMTHKPKQESIL